MNTNVRLDVSVRSRTGMGYSPFGKDSMRIVTFGEVANGEPKLDGNYYSRTGKANWTVNGQDVDPVMENGSVVFRYPGEVLHSWNIVDRECAAQWCNENGMTLMELSQDVIPGTNIRGYWC